MEDNFNKELDILLPDKPYDLECGERIKVCKVRFGQTRQLTKILNDLIEIAIENKLDLGKLDEKENIILLVTLGFQAVGNLIALLTKKDLAFIDDLTTDDVLGIVELIISMHMGSNTEKKLKSIVESLKASWNKNLTKNTH